MNIQTFYSSSKGNLYRIDDGKTVLLIDPGVAVGLIKESLGFGLHEVSGALVSHVHRDHSRGAKGLMEAGIGVWATRETLDAAELSGHRVHIIEARQQFQIGTWQIVPFDVPHDVQNVGFLLVSGSAKLVFATDCQYIPHRFRGITHLMIECNYDLDILKANLQSGALGIEAARRTVNNHMSLETVKGFLRAQDLSKLQEIHLLHLSYGNSDAGRYSREIQGLTGRPAWIGG